MLIETCRGFNPPIVEGGLQSLVVVVGVSGESRRSALCAEVCIGRLVLSAREPYRRGLKSPFRFNALPERIWLFL